MERTHITLKLLMALLILAAGMPCASAASSNDSIYLYGRVKEALGKHDLTDAVVYMMDNQGNPTDSCQCNKGKSYINGEIIDVSSFGFTVPKRDSVYVMDVKCPKYTTKTITYELKNAGKREQWRDIPVIFLERAPRELGEVTVTATKIKFYNRGDTVVYNADAFELAEGSMLDALVSQLPGVELKEGGQILVNGEQVESLLLNGKEFFNDNNELMLENIGAYTVKNVEVYKGNTTAEKMRGDTQGQKHLTMDVRLKREYNTGLTANVQAGYGTSDRYMGRLFSLWFNATTRLSLIGNINNLNDTRKPGQKDSWEPEMMPSGTRTYKMAAFDYTHESADEKHYFSGNIKAEHTGSDNRTTTATTNFLTSGNTYENSFSRNKTGKLRLSTDHSGYLRFGQWSPSYVMKGRWNDNDNDSESLSGSFSSEQQEMTMDALKAIYSDATPETLAAILNRASTRSDGRTKSGEIQFFPYIGYQIPHTEDQISNEFGVMYRSKKEDIWKDYTINYGADPTPADVRRQYIDNSPNTALTLQDNVTYRLRLNHITLRLNYEYKFYNENKDSYQYALDRLEDIGVFGSLPTGWANTLDPANSYTSRLYQNTHSISPSMNYHLNKNGHWLMVNLYPEFSFRHSHLDYHRNGISHPLRKNFFLASMTGWNGWISWYAGTKSDDGYLEPKHMLELRTNISPKAPDLFDMLDVTDDTNPLNIYVGNPDLKTAYTYAPSLEYGFHGRSAHPLTNNLNLQYSVTTNALTRGYSYDTKTGVRTNKMYNVDGNHSLSANNSFSLQFGPINQFTVSSQTNLTLGTYADMIGVDGSEPTLSKVNTNTVSERASFSWQIGKQSISVNGEYLNRHSFSRRPDFQSINANHFSYGIVGNFKLPYGIGINTDFNVYTRRGYGVKELDTSDAIWNARVTWTPPKAKEWTLMLDGFDMLHQLSNVNYAVTASGRTVSYSNALPRYAMISVQYRFHRQPRK